MDIAPKGGGGQMANGDEDTGLPSGGAASLLAAR
jgi:hypothetical protein